MISPKTTSNQFLVALLVLPSASYAQPEPNPLEPTSGSPEVKPAAEVLPDAKKRRIPPIGLDLEVIYLLDSKARENFGSTVVSIGPGLGNITPSIKGKWGLDFSLTRTDNSVEGNKNKLFMLAIGPEYRRIYIPSKYRDALKEARAAAEAGQNSVQQEDTALHKPAFLPYYGASLNAIYAQFEVPGRALDESGFGVGGTILAGATIKQRAFVEARLRAASNIKTFNFSGA
ncbi:MAG: hypothetical protein EOP09_16535, partial [Proteobacteria bacterium]